MLCWLIATGMGLGLSPWQDTPRLRTVVPNGAICFVQRIAGAKTVSVNLFVGARGAMDTPATHGYRHLLEHLVARSVPGQDQVLETAGSLLNPSTSREWIRFEWLGPASNLDLHLGYLDKTLRPFTFPEAMVKQEVRAIEHEGRLRSVREQLSAKAWTTVYGDRGLDPFGDLAVMGAAKPGDLSRVWARMLVGSNLVVSVAGDVDVDAVTAKVKGILVRLTDAKAPRWPERTVVGTSGGRDAIAASVPSVREPVTLAALGLALWATSASGESTMTYTPTLMPGLLLLSHPGRVDDLDNFMKRGDLVNATATVKDYARAWVRRRSDNPSSVAEFRGQLFSLELGLTPDKLLESCDSISSSTVREALDLLRGAARVSL